MMTLSEIAREIELQLQRKRARYGRASLEVLGRKIEVWGYKAVLRRRDQASYYLRYVYKIDGLRVSRDAVRAILKQEIPQ